jgi:hypothetical protein
MSIFQGAILSFAFTTTFMLGQQAPMAKPSSSPEFGFLKCQADAQKWTADPFDKTDPRTLGVNTAKMVWRQLADPDLRCVLTHQLPHRALGQRVKAALRALLLRGRLRQCRLWQYGARESPPVFPRQASVFAPS